MKVVVIPGDGIGPETVSVAVAALSLAAERSGAKLELIHESAGHDSLKKYGTTVRPELVETVEGADGMLLGPMTTHDLRHGVAGEINPSRYFRKHFDLYANIRPA